jgi:hypothetical protein
LAPAGHWLGPARGRYALGRASGCRHAADGHLAQQLVDASHKAGARLDFDLDEIFADMAVATTASLDIAA